MKVTELQVGDLVMCNGCVCRVYGMMMPIPRRDSRLDGKAVITLYCNGLIDASEDEIEPIPLTQEILEKNGWHRNSIFMELDADENTQFSWANRCGAVLFNNGWHHCDCKYVHTLQHAFRLCGFDDLADSIII